MTNIDLKFNTLNISNNSSWMNHLKSLNPKLKDKINLPIFTCDLSDSYVVLFEKEKDNLNMIGKCCIENINLDSKNLVQAPSKTITKNSNVLSLNLNNLNNNNIEIYAQLYLISKIKANKIPLNEKVNLNTTCTGFNKSSSKSRCDIKLRISENLLDETTKSLSDLSHDRFDKIETQLLERLEFVDQYDFEIKIDNSLIQNNDEINFRVRLDESNTNKIKYESSKSIEELVNSFEKCDTIDFSVSIPKQIKKVVNNKKNENDQGSGISSIRICSIERVVDESENDDKINEIYYQFNLKSDISVSESVSSDSSFSNGSLIGSNNNKRLKLTIESCKSLKTNSILTQFVCSNIKKFTCPFCFMQFKYLESMKKHFDNFHPRFTIKQDNSMSCLFFNVYPNPLNDCSCELENLYRMNEDQFRGYSRSRLMPTKNIILMDKLSLVDRLAYNSTTFMPKKPLDPDWDSDLEKDPEWFRVSTTRMLDEFDDVNEGEKDLMTMWNYFLMKNECIADSELINTLKLFIDQEYDYLVKLNLMNNFLLHLANLCEYDLIKPTEILELNDLIESKKVVCEIKQEIKQEKQTVQLLEAESSLNVSDDIIILD